MAIILNSFDGGTSGIAVSTANSGGGSGTAFSSVAGVSFSSGAAVHGPMGAITGPAGTSRYVRHDLTGATAVLARGYFRLAPSTNADTNPLRLGLSTGSVSAVWLGGANTGRLQLMQGSGAATSPAGLLTLGTLYRHELYCKPGSGDGEIRLAVYEGNATTPVWDSGLIGGRTINPLTYAYYGNYATTGAAVEFDSVGAKTDADAVWGAWPVANPAPTLTLTGPQNVTAGAAVQATASATDDGSIASYAWSVVQPSTVTPTLTGASTASVALTAPAAGNLVTLRCVVTDNLGAQTTKTTEVRVRTADQILRPYPLPGTGAAWTRTGGTSDGGAVADSDDGTYLQSPDLAATESARRLRLTCPSGPLSAATLSPKLGTDSGSGKATVRLYEGDTLRQDWPPITLTSTPTATTLTVSPDTMPYIGDWGNLAIEVGVTAS